ncbi:hypothetical protein PAXINDRAFT_182624 [Paxillus involutus ATCC 200175]|uniref:Uncharacterized protein n=1 Tax=Paxillus involutus ATCC 200175 TaxID=664439 RepID=A0A0C9THJ4_PAXIN|nr:hypothetical protein PAXINDRAFT_182624 [Paxillus involutus ATCC 200175]
MVMVISNYGVFATSFTQESCQRYRVVSPTFKVLQTMVSHAILGVRTFNITHRSRRIGIVLFISFVIATGLEWFTNLYDRPAVMRDGNCTLGNPDDTAWIYYVVVMVYDLGTLVVSTVYLARHNVNGRFSQLIKTMIYDGLGYFAALTAVNIFNIVLYRTSDEGLQSSGASFAYAVTWIMSQRILIHLREMTSESEGGHFNNVVVTRQLQPRRDLATAIHPQFELQKAPVDVELGPDSPAARSTDEMELDIQVHVEQSVTVYSGDRERFVKLRGQWEKIHTPGCNTYRDCFCEGIQGFEVLACDSVK